MKKRLTVQYSLHQMTYWAAAAGIMSFATAFLMEQGFAASQIGVLLASGNLLSCALQPLLAQRADRVGGNALTRLILLLTGACALCFVLLLAVPVPQWLYGLLYLMGIFTFDAMVPLMNAISVSCNEQGHFVNYGVGRGMGSVAFSVAALAIGEVIANWGADWMLYIVLVLLVANAFIVLRYPDFGEGRKQREEQVECCSVPVFLTRYKWYCVSLLGVMLLAMFHAMTENYLIEVVKPLGGDSGSVGVALFIATVVEMPVFLWFDRLRRHVRDNVLLKLGGLSFLLKSLLFLWAPSVPAIYMIQTLQATSYSFLSPTQLYYANNKIAWADMVKGQAFITASYTLGCAVGNFAGGQLLQFFDLRTMLLSGVAMAAAGTAILFLTVEKRDI